MNQDDIPTMLQEIRDLQRQQLEIARQGIANQVQAIANQTQAIEQQQRQLELAARSRRGLGTLIWVMVIVVVIAFFVPYINLWLKQLH